MRLLIAIFMVLLASACTATTSDGEETPSSDTQASPEDTVLPNEDVEVSETETGDTTPESDVPEGE